MRGARSAAGPGVLALVEARPVVQVVFLLRYVCAVGLAAAGGMVVPDPTRVLYGALSVAGCMIAVYLVNGLADVVEDRANGSVRPIASGRLPEMAATRYVLLAGGTGVGAAALVSPAAVVVSLLILGVGWAYSMGPRPWKNTVPMFMLAVFLLGACTYAMGVLVVGIVSAPVVLMGICLSAWMACAGSSKDLEDVHGDRIAGRRTWPVVLGERRARWCTAAAALAVGVKFVAGAWFVPLLIPVAAGLLLGAAYLATVLCLSRRLPGKPYAIFMVTQYAVHGLAIAVLVAA